MLTIRVIAVAVFVAAIVAGTPALAACDSDSNSNSIYSPNCRPIPANDPPEEATETTKVSKPLQITRRKAARSERSAQSQRKRFGKKTGTQRALTVRQRRAKALAAVPRQRVKPAAVAADDALETPAPAPVRRTMTPQRVTAADPGASTGEASDVSAATDVLQPTAVVTAPAAPVEAPRVAPPANSSVDTGAHGVARRDERDRPRGSRQSGRRRSIMDAHARACFRRAVGGRFGIAPVSVSDARSIRCGAT